MFTYILDISDEPKAFVDLFYLNYFALVSVAGVIGIPSDDTFYGVFIDYEDARARAQAVCTEVGCLDRCELEDVAYGDELFAQSYDDYYGQRVSIIRSTI